MQQSFISDDFLLYSKQARILYYDYAKDLPVIDYHSHLPPAEIVVNKKFSTLTEIWLKGDHYKWRAMRTLGVAEKYITGSASDEEKFLEWAKVVPLTIRNPLFHWTHMELKNPFGIQEYLTAESAHHIYHHCNDLLQQDDFAVQSLLKHFYVEMIGTTDDPCDELAEHRQLLSQGFNIKVCPTFRPDKILNIRDSTAFFLYLQRLENVSGIAVKDFTTLLEALLKRVDYFHSNGCRISDHGLSYFPEKIIIDTSMEKEFREFLDGTNAQPFSQPDTFAGYILSELCRMYHAKGWVQQFHVGALRNNNTRMVQQLGADSGFDSIGDNLQAATMAKFFDALDQHHQLTKTIIYNNNPSGNEVFATMIGNFNDGSVKGKIQFGSAWWFLDQKDGIERQLNALSNTGLISAFAGMVTDSRSFLSYSRHEYFRRILCNLFGNEMAKGELPDDAAWIGKIIQDICYNNAKAYFNV